MNWRWKNVPRKTLNRFEAMVRLYGQMNLETEVKCANCCNFVYCNNRPKCVIYGVTNYDDTDWHPNVNACGHYQIERDADDVAVRKLMPIEVWVKSDER